MSSQLPPPPRIGPRIPLPPPPRESAQDGDEEGLRNGDILEGRYQIVERIGEGGVGFVFRATQLKLHRNVAVKLLQQDTVGEEELRPRFEREALTLAALSHPNIVSLQDYGMVRGKPFLVMELLEGRTVREVLDEEGALNPERALTLLRQVLLALAYAHKLGIVHRDLKPANLLVQALPAHEHVKVLDFGLVKLLPGSYLDRGVQLSRVGFTFGTPAYMSPEHATGGQVDGRSDLYSLGILLFEMLTGDKPFDGEFPDVLRHHLSTPMPPLSERKPELAARQDLQRLLDGMLAKPRDQRYAQATDVIAAFDAILARKAALPGTSMSASERHAITSQVHELQGVGFDGKRQGWGRAARSAYEGARESLRPALQRAKPTLERVVGASRMQLAKAGRRMLRFTGRSWAWLQPRLARTAERVANAALQAKARVESAKPALPPPTQALPVQPDMFEAPTLHASDAPEPPAAPGSAPGETSTREGTGPVDGA